MARFRYVLMLATLLAGQLFAFASPTYACSCIMPPAPEQALADASAVFAGQVVDAAPEAEGEVVSSADPIAYTFEVSEVWKGEATPTVIIRTARDSASCGFSFVAGESYVVYATESEGVLSTNLCSRTAPLANAEEDLTALGEGQVPDPAEPVLISAPDTPDTPDATDTADAAVPDASGLSFLAWGLIALGIVLLVGVPTLLMQRRDSGR